MKKFGLVGQNIKYSYSKDIHEFLRDYYKINLTYDLINVEQLDQRLIDSYDGLNITTPYKEKVLDLDLKIDKTVLNAGCCNTIHQKTAFNYDLEAFLYLLGVIKCSHIKRCVIIGSGACSTMIKNYFEKQGIDVVILSRKYETEESLIYGDALINASLIGQGIYENDAAIKEHLVIKFKYVIDLNYNPNINKLIMYAKKNNITNINGIYMLIYQALKAFSLWNDIEFDISMIDKIKMHLDNIKLIGTCYIGMPYAGKTTLINKLGGIDLDDSITNYTQKTIKDIFKDVGEPGFRNIESKVLSKIIDKKPKYISLGGGTILNFNNLMLLKNYKIIYLDTPICELITRIDSNRPLISNENDLIKLYEQRDIIYKNFQNSYIYIK